MFKLFKKSVGIHILDGEAHVVSLKDEHKMPTLDEEYSISVNNIVEKGDLIDSDAFVSVLKTIKDKLGADGCCFALPVSKSFSALISFPANMNDELIEASLDKKVSELIPFSLDEIDFQKSIVRGIVKDKTIVAITGFEKTLLDKYKKAFEQAGMEANYYLESVALSSLAPVDGDKYPAVMFVHAFDGKVLISSLFHGVVIDSFLSDDLANDFSAMYSSYVRDLGLAPSHIIVSGESKLLEGLSNIKFNGEQPKFISPNYLVDFGGEEKNISKILIASGLAFLDSKAKKRDGVYMTHLLE